MFEKHFTLAEARAMIPWVHSVFEKVHLALDAFARGPGRPKSAARVDIGEDPGDTFTPPPQPELDARRLIESLSPNELKELIEKLIRGIEARGVVIQDVRRGLIDFPSVRNGEEEVLLCYELADNGALDHYHDLTSGFAGRRKIKPEEFE